MDTRYLRAFVAVAEHGGISIAAERLGYAQSSLSAQLRRLEDDLGVRVLNRTATGTELTQAGRSLLPYAVQFLELEDRMRRAAREVSPRIRVGALETFPEEWLADILTAYKHGAAGPGAREVTLTIADRQQLTAGLANGHLDLVFVYDNGVPATGPHDILGEERVVLVAAPEHPLAKTTTLDPAELMTAEFLIVDLGCSSDMLLRRYGHTLSQDTPIGMVTGSLSALRRMLTFGHGVALLPEMGVRAELDNGDLVCLDPAIDDLSTVHIEARWRDDAETLIRPLLTIAQRHTAAITAEPGVATPTRS